MSEVYAPSISWVLALSPLALPLTDAALASRSFASHDTTSQCKSRPLESRLSAAPGSEFDTRCLCKSNVMCAVLSADCSVLHSYIRNIKK
ncbi:hypothetical protein V8E36_006953 [Tilletia maclaganii]